MSVHVLEERLASVLLTTLRDKRVRPPQFRNALHRLSLLLAVRACEHIAVETETVHTPLETVEGTYFEPRIALVPIMRAGAGMVDAFHTFLPEADVWHISMSRNPDTLEPEFHGSKVPRMVDPGIDPHNRICFVLDPMLATGGSASLAIQKLKDAGAQNIVFVGIFGAPEGVARLAQDHPDVPLLLAVIDRQLNTIGYILPGCGDAGDRLNGTQH